MGTFQTENSEGKKHKSLKHPKSSNCSGSVKWRILGENQRPVVKIPEHHSGETELHPVRWGWGCHRSVSREVGDTKITVIPFCRKLCRKKLEGLFAIADKHYVNIMKT